MVRKGKNKSIPVPDIEGGRFKGKLWNFEGKTKYAVRCLQEGVEGEEQMKGMKDLAAEAMFLLKCQHPNILKPKGIMCEPDHPHFMLVLDQMQMKLTDKIDLWKAEKSQNIRRNLFNHKKKLKSSRHSVLMERLAIAHEIASVMEYLHDKKVIYRNLKPKNIGFDYQGNVRIFEFALAKKVSKNLLVMPPDGYNCTGLVGSRRWMTPEVYLSRPYGFSSDVYSFGLLFWNIFSLKFPFEGMDAKQHFHCVIRNHERPETLKVLPKAMNHLITCCCNPTNIRRPSFTMIAKYIQNQVERHQPESRKEE